MRYSLNQNILEVYIILLGFTVKACLQIFHSKLLSNYSNMNIFNACSVVKTYWWPLWHYFDEENRAVIFLMCLFETLLSVYRQWRKQWTLFSDRSAALGALVVWEKGFFLIEENIILFCSHLGSGFNIHMKNLDGAETYKLLIVFI